MPKRALKEDSCPSGNVIKKKQIRDGPSSNAKTPLQKMAWPEYFNEVYMTVLQFDTLNELSFFSSLRCICLLFLSLQ